MTDELECPRGSILVQALVKDAGITKARLPCRFFERQPDWHLNQVLLTGVLMAASMADDPALRQHLHRCAARFGEVAPMPILREKDVELAKRELTRLTDTFAPALSIIELLRDMRGIALEAEAQRTQIPGFLFDMNTFFQSLLSRFLHDNLVHYRIEDEFVLREAFAYRFTDRILTMIGGLTK